MRNNNHARSNAGAKSRRGVAGIISGVILVGVLLTSVLVYFISVANNDKTRTGYEIAAHDEDAKKATERYTASVASITSGNMNVAIDNYGPIPIRASQMLLYCIEGTGCAPTVPIATAPISTTVNTGTSVLHTIGPVTSGNTYRVDVISERGNIVSSSCDVNGTACAVPPLNLGNLGTNPGVVGAVNEGIIQGTGSLQLDFKAFGALFPQLASRNGVDQTGWKVKTTSPYGSATGYPAFDLPSNLNTIIVERARNLDPSGQDILLNRNTALIVNVGKTTSGQPDPNYICYADKTQQNLTLYPYDETTSHKTTLPSTSLNASRTTGWAEMWFCSTSPNSTSPSWKPDNKFNNINGLFMVARGTFAQSNAEYAQTIPYQAVSVGTAASGNVPDLQACILAANSNTSCPSFSTSANNPSTFKYSEAANNLFITPSARTAYIHVNTANPNPTDPISVSWVYPNGTQKILAQNVNVNTGNTNRNIPISIPFTNTDGTKISPGYYTIIVTDSYDSISARNAYYMTFQVT
jgi:hypothetical protein